MLSKDMLLFVMSMLLISMLFMSMFVIGTVENMVGEIKEKMLLTSIFPSHNIVISFHIKAH